MFIFIYLDFIFVFYDNIVCYIDLQSKEYHDKTKNLAGYGYR
jgi:hypothetical protein